MTQTNRKQSDADAVLAQLAAGFEDLSAQLQRAARFVIDNPREVGVQSMRSLASQAEVHPNTLVRLAQALGFDGWEAMREPFRSFVVDGGGFGAYGTRAEWLRQLAARGGTAAVIAEMATATTQNLETMWQGAGPSALEAAADKILAARQGYVLGAGSAYALAYQFWYVTRMGFGHLSPIPRAGTRPVDDIAWIGPEDVLIAMTFQPYRADTMEAARMAKEAGATVIGITDGPTSPLARLADHPLTTPTHTPQFFHSQSAAVALLEALTAVMISRAGEDATRRIEAFHQRRLADGLYDEPDALARIG